MPDPRVKIVAIASNEGQYLPQWIYHHRYMGFDAFDIYINRTFDKTQSILKKLATYFGNINIYNSDWIDVYYKNSPPFSFIQSGPYLQSYYNTSDEFDYLLYIDVDEFWTSLNCKDKIQDCIRKLSEPDGIIFEWFYIGGREFNVNPLFAIKYFYGHPGKWIKYMVKTGLKPLSTGVHFPKFNSIDRVVLADGEEHLYNKENPSMLHHTQSHKMRDYFILHDAMRTPLNCFSKLRRGRAALGKCNEVKNMATVRPIFYNMTNTPDQQVFATNFPENYYAGYRKMFHELELGPDIYECRIVEYLMSLDCIRLLKLNEQSDISKKIIRKFGKLEGIHRALLMELSHHEPSYSEISEVPIVLRTDFEDDSEKAYEKLRLTCALYPYAIDDQYHPLFFKSYLHNRVVRNKMDEVYRVLEDKNLLPNKVYGIEWAIPYVKSLCSAMNMLEHLPKFLRLSRYL